MLAAAASEECLLSAVYTFSSVALPETMSATQLASVHSLVSEHLLHISAYWYCFTVYICQL